MLLCKVNKSTISIIQITSSLLSYLIVYNDHQWGTIHHLQQHFYYAHYFFLVALPPCKGSSLALIKYCLRVWMRRFFAPEVWAANILVEKRSLGQKSRSAGDLNASSEQRRGVYFIYLGDYTHSTRRTERCCKFFLTQHACKYIRNEKNAVCWSPYGALMNAICLRGQSHHTQAAAPLLRFIQKLIKN